MGDSTTSSSSSDSDSPSSDCLPSWDYSYSSSSGPSSGSSSSSDSSSSSESEWTNVTIRGGRVDIIAHSNFTTVTFSDALTVMGKRSRPAPTPEAQNSESSGDSPPHKQAKHDAGGTGNSSSKPYNCPVCLNDVRKGEPVATTCGHIFCRICIQEAIRTTLKCPMCKVLSPKFHRIFM